VSRRAVLSGLAGAAALISAVTVVSRLLGFARNLVFTNAVGLTDVGDAYNWANTLPNVLFEVAAGGALAGALIPVLAAPIARQDRGQVDRTVAGALGWTLIVLVPLAALLAAFSGPISHALAGGHGADQAELIQFFILVFAVQVPMYGVAVLLYAVLQAHKKFFWPAFAPVMSSLVVIVTYLVYGALANGEVNDAGKLDPGALDALAWGTTLGVAAMCLPMFVPVHRLGVRVRPSLRFPEGVGRRLLGLALAGVGSVAAQQLTLLVIAGVASSDRGAFTQFLYVQQVYLLPYAVLVVPLATSTFPRLAARAAAGDRDGFARMASTTTRGVLVAAAVGGAAVVAAAGSVATIFGTLARDPQVVDAMSGALTWMVPGLAGFAVMFHASRALYALERGRAAVTANVTGWGVVAIGVVVLTALDVPAGGTVVSIGAASSVGMLVGGVVALVALGRAAGRAVWTGIARTAGVLVLGAVAGAVAGRWISDTVQDVAGDGMAAAVGAAAGGGIVAALVVAVAVLALDRGTVTGVLGVEREPVAPDSGADLPRI